MESVNATLEPHLNFPEQLISCMLLTFWREFTESILTYKAASAVISHEP